MFDWIIQAAKSKPEAFVTGGFALIVAIIGAWATLRAARKKADPPQSTPRSLTANKQTGQSGGQGVQAGTIRGPVTLHQGPTFDATQIARDYGDAMRRIGALETENQQLREQIAQYDDQSQKALTEAVEDLVERAEAIPGPDEFETALHDLQAGHPAAAEATFHNILEEKKAAGRAQLNEAARAARHIGAIAFYHDTQKALRAYTQAIELDRDDAEAWIQLGRLRHRIGDLAAAQQAYERVLSLGNNVGDRSVIADATRYLGNVHLMRGDFVRADAAYRQALALDEELGRKEGMANVYGNLGVLYRRRDDLARAEEMHRKSLALNVELGRKEGMASAYGNLALVYQARGDLIRAEEMHQIALALNEELGRKEGMATDYGNLGLLMIKKGDREEGCRLLGESWRLFLEVRAKDGADWAAGLMRDAGCPDAPE